MSDFGINRTTANPPTPPTGDEEVSNQQRVGGTNVAPPPVDHEEEDHLPSYGRPELAAPRKPGTGADLAILIQEIRAKLTEVRQQTSTEDILTRSEKQKTKREDRLQQLEDSLKSSGKANKAGDIGKALGWITAAAMIIGGIALIATGKGAAVGVGLLAGGIMMAGIMALEQSGAMDKLTKKIGGLLEMAGMDPKAAQIVAGVIVAVAVMAVMAATGIGAAKASGGIAAKMGTQVAVLAVKSAHIATAVEVSRGVAMAAKMAGATAGLGKAVTTGTQAYYNYDAAQHKANADESLALIRKIQKMIEDEIARLDQILRELNEGTSIAIEAIRDEHETNTRILQI